MSRFSVKRSLKQLYIEKHAMEQFISQKKGSNNSNETTDKQLSDLQSEEALLKEILANIQHAESIAKRNTTIT